MGYSAYARIYIDAHLPKKLIANLRKVVAEGKDKVIEIVQTLTGNDIEFDVVCLPWLLAYLLSELGFSRSCEIEDGVEKYIVEQWCESEYWEDENELPAELGPDDSWVLKIDASAKNYKGRKEDDTHISFQKFCAKEPRRRLAGMCARLDVVMGGRDEWVVTDEDKCKLGDVHISCGISC